MQQSKEIGRDFIRVHRLTLLCSFFNIILIVCQVICEMISSPTIWKNSISSILTSLHEPSLTSFVKLAIKNADLITFLLIQPLKLLLASMTVLSILCRNDFSQMWEIMSRSTFCRCQQIQIAYCGQIFNDMTHTLTHRQERQFYLAALLASTFIQISLKYLTVANLACAVNFDQIQQPGFPSLVVSLIQNSFFLIIGGNELTPIFIFTISQVILDKLELESWVRIEQKPQLQRGQSDMISVLLIHIFGVVLFLILSKSQIREYNLGQINKLSAFEVASLRTQKQNEIRVAISAKQSTIEEEYGCKIAYDSFLRALREPLTIDRIGLKVLSNTSNLRIKFQSEFIDQTLSLRRFMISIGSFDFKLVEDFLLDQINTETLCQFPAVCSSDHCTAAKSQKLILEAQGSHLSLQYDRKVNVLIINVQPQARLVSHCEQEDYSAEQMKEMETDQKDSSGSSKTSSNGNKTNSIIYVDPAEPKEPPIQYTDQILEENHEVQSSYNNQLSLKNNLSKNTSDNLSKQASFAELVADEQMKKDDAQESKLIRKQSKDLEQNLNSGTESQINSSFDRNSSGYIMNRGPKNLNQAIKFSKNQIDLYSSQCSIDLYSHQSQNVQNSKDLNNAYSDILIANNSLVKQILDNNPTYNSNDEAKQIVSTWIKKSISSITSNTLSGKLSNKISEVSSKKTDSAGQVVETAAATHFGLQSKQLILKQLLLNEVENKSDKMDNSQAQIETEEVYQDLLMSKVEALRNKLKNNRIFMDMVIHDMRNPTNSIQFAITETLLMLKNQRAKIKSIMRHKAMMINQMKSQIHLQQSLSNSSNSMIGFDSSSFRHNMPVNDSRNYNSMSNRFTIQKLKGESSSLLFDKINHEEVYKSYQSVIMQDLSHIPLAPQIELQQSDQHAVLQQNSKQTVNLMGAFFSDQVRMTLLRIRKLSKQSFSSLGEQKAKSLLNKGIKSASFRPLPNTLAQSQQIYLIRQSNEQMEEAFQEEEQKEEEQIPQNSQVIGQSNSRDGQRSQNIFISENNFPNREIGGQNHVEEERKSLQISQINERSENSHQELQSLPQIPQNFSDEIDQECDIDEADCDENANQIVPNSEAILEKLKVFKANDNEIKKKDARELQNKFDELQTTILHQFEKLKAENQGHGGVQRKYDQMIEMLTQCKEFLSLAIEKHELQSHQIILYESKKKVEQSSKGCQIDDQFLAGSIQYSNNNQLRQGGIHSQDNRNLNSRLLENDEIPANMGSQHVQNPRMIRNSNSMSESFDGLDEEEFIIKRVKVNKSIQCCIDDHLADLCRSYSDIPSDKVQLQEQYQQLRVKNEQLKIKVQMLSNQNKDFKGIIEIYDKRLKEIEEQDFFEGPFFDKLDRLLQNTEFSAKMLSNLISDMLDLAKYEAGTFKFYNEFFDLNEVVHNAFDTVRYQSDKKEIKLEFEVVDERKTKKISRLTLNEIIIQEFNNASYQNPATEKINQESKCDERNSQQPPESILQNNSESNDPNESDSCCTDNIPSNKGDKSLQPNLDITDNTNNTNLPMNSVNSKSIDAKMFFSELYGDKNRFTQIVLNFLSNAIHYSNKGGTITIRLVLMEEQSTFAKKSPLSQQQRSINSNKCKKESVEGPNEYQLEQVKSKPSGEVNKFQKAINNIKSDVSSHSSSRSYIEQNEHQYKEQEQINSMLLDDQNNSSSNNSVSKISYRRNDKNTRTEFEASRDQSLQREPQDQGLKFIKFRIEIRDTGVGIKKENLNSLFKDFSRLDQSMNKKGTGLGLSICKNLIEKMGGKVDVESEFGKGSTFKIQLSTKTNPFFANQKIKNASLEKDSNKNADVDFDYQSMSIQKNMIGLRGSDAVEMNMNQDIQNSEQSNLMNGMSLNNKNIIINRKSSLQINQHYIESLERNAKNNDYSENFSITKRIDQHYTGKFPESQYSGSGEAYQGISSSVKLESGAMRSQKQNSGSMQSYISMMGKGIYGIQQQDNRVEEEKDASSSQYLKHLKKKRLDESDYFESKSQAKKYMKRAGTVKGANSHDLNPSTRKQNQCSDSISSLFSMEQQTPQFQSCSIKSGQISPNSNKESFSMSVKESIKKVKNDKIIEQKMQQLQSSLIDEESKDEVSVQDDQEESKDQQDSTVRVADKEFRCLLANDCDLQLMIMTHILEECGVQVVTAINGLDALEQVVESQQRFDFIVLDLTMPIMDGYEAARKIIDHYKGTANLFQESSNASMREIKLDQHSSELQKSEQKLSQKSQHILDLYEEIGQVPFMIACSAYVSDEVKSQCMEIGFNLVLEAPISVQMINNQVLSHLRMDKKCKLAMENQIINKMNSQNQPKPKIFSSAEVDQVFSSQQLEKVNESEDQKDEDSVSVKSKFSMEQEPY